MSDTVTAELDTPQVDLSQVQSYWNENPLCASLIPHELGSREYFEYYDRLREANESVAFSYWLHEYRQFAGKRVLDVGCGNGYVLSRYAREGARVTGVDITPTGIELCRKRFAYMGLSGDFQVGNAEALPFPDASFDCVCSMGVLHHTPDTARAVGEIHRVLKPGGRLIVMFYHRNSALYQLMYRLQSVVRGKSMQQLVNEYDGVGNPKGDVYSRRQLRRLLSRFERLEMFADFLRGDMVLPKVGRFIPGAVLRPLAGRFGWFLYARGYKPAAGGHSTP